MKPEIEAELLEMLCKWNWGEPIDVTYELWKMLWDERPVKDNLLRQAWDKYWKLRRDEKRVISKHLAK
jgi:hypothetical protein